MALPTITRDQIIKMIDLYEQKTTGNSPREDRGTLGD